MPWKIVLIPEFALWLDGLDSQVRIRVLSKVKMLEEWGPKLGRPSVGHVKHSEFGNMKELRVQVGGDPWRVLFAFDPRQTGVLLVGGDKGGDERWYKDHIPIADELYRRHLRDLDLDN